MRFAKITGITDRYNPKDPDSLTIGGICFCLGTIFYLSLENDNYGYQICYTAEEYSPSESDLEMWTMLYPDMMSEVS